MSGIDGVTKEYVDIMTNNKYASRTSNSTEFDALKDQYSVYLSPDAECIPPKKYTRLLALLIAHHYALDDTNTPDEGGSDKYAGPITQESVGDVSIGYGSMGAFKSTEQGWKQYLSLTRWGVEFLYLMKTFRPTPLVV